MRVCHIIGVTTSKHICNYHTLRQPMTTRIFSLQGTKCATVKLPPEIKCATWPRNVGMRS